MKSLSVIKLHTLFLRYCYNIQSRVFHIILRGREALRPILVEVFHFNIILTFYELLTGWEERFLNGVSLLGFVWNAKRFAIAYVLLLVFLPVISRDFWIINQYSWFYKSHNMSNWGNKFSFFQGIHVIIDVRTDISISMTYHHQIWQSGTSTRFDSNETNKAGASDPITSR